TLLGPSLPVVARAPRRSRYTGDLVRLLGCEARCAGVGAVSLPPLGEVPPSPEVVLAALVAQVTRAEVEDGADVVILGGARLSPYAADLHRAVQVPALEPVACAVSTAEALGGFRRLHRSDVRGHRAA